MPLTAGEWRWWRREQVDELWARLTGILSNAADGRSAAEAEEVVVTTAMES